MNTPTHLLLTAAASRVVSRTTPVARGAALWGSVAPDLPLLLLSLGGLLWYRLYLGWPVDSVLTRLYDELFFRDPGWIVAHNTLQAPLVLGAGIALCRLLRARAPRLTHWWTWFLAACLLHSLVDVVTHHDDGPLLAFPFDWGTRFASPVSYWDPRHHGDAVWRFELALDAALLLWLLAPALARRLRARQNADPGGGGEGTG